mmetsp:Transcript_10282/g.63043  ORF Transcript_10282/g.63043 Transcript_10282/m.63043 type:complete len:223 (+) Transcript_10282:413-1081(+)
MQTRPSRCVPLPSKQRLQRSQWLQRQPGWMFGTQGSWSKSLCQVIVRANHNFVSSTKYFTALKHLYTCTTTRIVKMGLSTRLQSVMRRHDGVRCQPPSTLCKRKKDELLRLTTKRVYQEHLLARIRSQGLLHTLQCQTTLEMDWQIEQENVHREFYACLVTSLGEGCQGDAPSVTDSRRRTELLPTSGQDINTVRKRKYWITPSVLLFNSSLMQCGSYKPAL